MADPGIAADQDELPRRRARTELLEQPEQALDRHVHDFGGRFLAGGEMHDMGDAGGSRGHDVAIGDRAARHFDAVGFLAANGCGKARGCEPWKIADRQAAGQSNCRPTLPVAPVTRISMHFLPQVANIGARSPVNGYLSDKTDFWTLKRRCPFVRQLIDAAHGVLRKCAHRFSREEPGGGIATTSASEHERSRATAILQGREARRLVAVLELTNISKHFGAIQAVNDVSLVARSRPGRRPDGRQRRRQVDAGQDDRRQFPAEPRHHAHGRRRDSSFTGRSRRASTASRSSTRTWRCATI